MRDVIVFCFGGRRPNLELQLPFIHRILGEHPNVQYHLWNLARDPDDAEYLKDADDNHPRITVMNQFAGDTEPWRHFDDVYRFYSDEKWKDCLFVKLDDDVVFLETDGFANFVNAVEMHPEAVVSAQVINNGACTPTFPILSRQFNGLRMRLLDWHLKAKTAWIAHNYFFDNWADLLGARPKVIHTKEWLSINVIGYDWEMGKRIAGLLGTRSPRSIAGRPFTPRATLGDEGTVNTLPRIIFQGFLACHLYFGPQARNMNDAQLDQLRDRYRIIGKEHLG